MNEGKALISSLNNNRALEQLATDSTELTLDQFLQHGLIREIPIFKTLAAVARVGFGLRDYLFTKKINRFLQSVEPISEEEKQAFLNRYGDTDLGDDVLLQLEKADTTIKAEYIGRIFFALLKNKVDHSEFGKICHGINRCKTETLNEIYELYYPQITPIDSPGSDDLFQGGFLTLRHSQGLLNGQGSSYMHNKLGKLFIEHCLNKIPR